MVNFFRLLWDFPYLMLYCDLKFFEKSSNLNRRILTRNSHSPAKLKRYFKDLEPFLLWASKFTFVFLLFLFMDIAMLVVWLMNTLFQDRHPLDSGLIILVLPMVLAGKYLLINFTKQEKKLFAKIIYYNSFSRKKKWCIGAICLVSYPLVFILCPFLMTKI